MLWDHDLNKLESLLPEDASTHKHVTVFLANWLKVFKRIFKDLSLLNQCKNWEGVKRYTPSPAEHGSKGHGHDTILVKFYVFVFNV